MKTIIKFNRLTHALNEYHKNLYNYSTKKKLRYTNLYAFIEQFVILIFYFYIVFLRFGTKF